ncbi:MAG: maleylpyruvate isomerase family mycothiol-dependent enzyme [Aeromicrobium sp.]
MDTAPLDHLAELDDAVGRFAELVRQGSGQEPVPSCGGWVMRDLVEHVGTVHRWAASIVLSGHRAEPPAPLVTEPLADWYAGTAAALLAALRAVDPAEVVPNFTQVDETAAFWPRRQLLETTVHAVDAAQALGLDEERWAVPGAVAADGIDEVLRVLFLRMTARGRRPDVRSRIRLVATDVDRSWVVAPGEGEAPPLVLRDPSADADETVTGTAADLYLALWHRVSRDRLGFEGPHGPALLDGPTTP